MDRRRGEILGGAPLRDFDHLVEFAAEFLQSESFFLQRILQDSFQTIFQDPSDDFIWTTSDNFSGPFQTIFLDHFRQFFWTLSPWNDRLFIGFW